MLENLWFSVVVFVLATAPVMAQSPTATAIPDNCVCYAMAAPPTGSAGDGDGAVSMWCVCDEPAPRDDFAVYLPIVLK